ncbi:hypothetical protein Z949_753 [Sulfitobacter guttiformis KCTC 32187]|nr:hypothetical protein Z949_753 [Sulfitobacter guttiformis KCTC 32187]
MKTLLLVICAQFTGSHCNGERGCAQSRGQAEGAARMACLRRTGAVEDR